MHAHAADTADQDSTASSGRQHKRKRSRSPPPKQRERSRSPPSKERKRPQSPKVILALVDLHCPSCLTNPSYLPPGMQGTRPPLTPYTSQGALLPGAKPRLEAGMSPALTTAGRPPAATPAPRDAVAASLLPTGGSVRQKPPAAAPAPKDAVARRRPEAAAAAPLPRGTITAPRLRGARR